MNKINILLVFKYYFKEYLKNRFISFIKLNFIFLTDNFL